MHNACTYVCIYVVLYLLKFAVFLSTSWLSSEMYLHKSIRFCKSVCVFLMIGQVTCNHGDALSQSYQAGEGWLP